MKRIFPNSVSFWLPVLLAISLVGGAFPPFAGWCHADENAVQSSEKLAKIFAGSVPQDVDDLRAMQDHLQRLIQKVIPCTVGIQIGAAQGSGVIVSEDGYVLTAAHVAGKPGRNALLLLANGRRIQAVTLGLNRTIDAGLMKITSEGPWPFVEMGSSSELKEGQWCMVTGHPGGYQRGRKPVLRFGRVLHNEKSVVVTDCALVGGDSGGPLFDMQGKVIGINSRIGGALTSNMHVPVNTYRDDWDRMIAGEAWGSTAGERPFIGVQGDTESEKALIAAVYPDTPAEKAGIKPGDIITQFDGQPIKDFAELRALVGEKKPGDEVEIQVLRDDKMVTFKLVVGKLGG